MKKFLSKAGNGDIRAELNIPGSKSETNRLLILQAIYPNIKLENASDSDDSLALRNALAADQNTIDIGHAGTAMRFLTSYFAFEKGVRIITGSPRMQNRPIRILVDALNSLGAAIAYPKKEGFPPLLIHGQNPKGDSVEIDAGVSSQFSSALLLIAPTLPNGLNLRLSGKILSRPYIKMSLGLLRELGIPAQFEGRTIRVSPKKSILSKTMAIESDWSSASYFYSLAALSESARIRLAHFRKNSLQGDAILAKIFESFSVETVFDNNTITLKKQEKTQLPKRFEVDLSACPDLAQTLAVTGLGLRIDCRLTGLQSLKIKETDRLKALKNELSKFGAKVTIDKHSIDIHPPENLKKNVSVNTYGDHRMAMAFAPLAQKTALAIENPEVVSKSFPGFWECLASCGLS